MLGQPEDLLPPQGLQGGAWQRWPPSARRTVGALGAAPPPAPVAMAAPEDVASVLCRQDLPLGASQFLHSLGRPVLPPQPQPQGWGAARRLPA